VAFCKQIYIRLAELGCLPVDASRRDLIQHAPTTSCSAAKPLITSITNKPRTMFLIHQNISSRRAEY
jgi:hypothetical protein